MGKANFQVGKQVIVNINILISTAAQVQTYVESEKFAFLEFPWVVANNDVPIYNRMAIGNLIAPKGPDLGLTNMLRMLGVDACSRRFKWASELI
jgi:hypothetical protein